MDRRSLLQLIPASFLTSFIPKKEQFSLLQLCNPNRKYFCHDYLGPNEEQIPLCPNTTNIEVNIVNCILTQGLDSLKWSKFGSFFASPSKIYSFKFKNGKFQLTGKLENNRWTSDFEEKYYIIDTNLPLNDMYREDYDDKIIYKNFQYTGLVNFDFIHAGILNNQQFCMSLANSVELISVTCCEEE